MVPVPEDDPESGPRTAAFWRRFLPRSVLGLAGLLFCMSIAAAFTGSVLYAYYRYELTKTEDKVNSFQAKFDDKVKEATAAITKERDSSVQEVKRQLDELQKFSASGETLTSLLTKVAPSVFFVSTLDENGQPSVGSAFVVSSDSSQTFLLTSYTTIRAATRQPAPPITVSKTGEPDLKATLNGWDAGNDLALLIINKANVPALKWADGSPVAVVGDRVFVVSGLGAAGGAISQGFVADVSANGIQHDSPIGASFQGGPLLNSKGEVLASASRTYSPLKFTPEAVFFGVPIRNACASVLKCPNGGAPAN